MNRNDHRRDGLGTLELIEESVHLLRLSPGRVLTYYYLGSLPFILGLLYFWAAMSRSVSAEEQCAPAALGMAFLFAWMKTWQAVFARGLRVQLAGRESPRLPFLDWLRIGVSQTAIHATGLFLLPVALVLTFPFGWIYAFYQNATALGDDTEARRLTARAWMQATLWPAQNHCVLLVLSVFGLVVFLDVAIGLAQIPLLLKALLGIESAFSRSYWTFLNSTFLAAVFGVAYLCLDPLFKAIYVLRCFYGESRRTGEDLKAELRRLGPKMRAAAVLALVLGALVVLAAPAAAAQSSSVPPDRLDRAIDEVIAQPEYQWRLPREHRLEEASHGWLADAMKGLRNLGRTAKKWARAAARFVRETLEWLDEKFFGKRQPAEPGAVGHGVWKVSLQLLVGTLLALVAGTAAIFFWRAWKGRRRTTEAVSQAVGPVPDLADENVVASQLPEDEWLKLAGDLMGKGEMRLALRAFYLANLAHLARREMITVAKFKSNRDYAQELRRRARAWPEVQTAFAQNVTIFDRVWYGLHEVTADVLQLFQVNFEKIRTC